MKFPSSFWNAKLLSAGLYFGAIGALSMTPLARDASHAGNAPDKDVMALLDLRSPGARPDGALITSKPVAPAGMPREYAMPKVRERFPPGGAAAPGQPLGAPVALYPRDTGAVPLDRIASVSGPGLYYPFPGGGFEPGGIGIPPVGGAGVPPPADGGNGGDNGGGPGGNSGGGNVPSSPLAPVPEPAAWINLILGFGAIGTMIRARRGSRHQPARA
jgi:hypothetical protein